MERGSLLLEHANERKAVAQERREWTQERSDLLTRIQHPHYLVGAAQDERPNEDFMTAEEPDDIDLVGTVQNGNEDADV